MTSTGGDPTSLEKEDAQALSQSLQDYYYARDEGPDARLRAANNVRQQMMKVQNHYGASGKSVLSFDPSKMQDPALEKQLDSLVPKPAPVKVASSAANDNFAPGMSSPLNNCALLVTIACNGNPMAARPAMIDPSKIAPGPGVQSLLPPGVSMTFVK